MNDNNFISIEEVQKYYHLTPKVEIGNNMFTPEEVRQIAWAHAIAAVGVIFVVRFIFF